MLTFSAQRAIEIAKGIRVVTKGDNKGGIFKLTFDSGCTFQKDSTLGYVTSIDHYYIIVTYWYILVCRPASLTSLAAGFNSITDIQEVLDTHGTEILYKELV